MPKRRKDLAGDDDFSDEDIDEVIDSLPDERDGSYTGTVRLSSTTPKKSALGYAESQTSEAFNRLALDSRKFPRFGLPSLHRLTGSFAPQSLIVVTGDTGNGKSLFAHNLIEMLRRQRVATGVIGTEQSPHLLRIKHACHITGSNQKLILTPEDWEVDSDERGRALEDVKIALVELENDGELIQWADEAYISRDKLKIWVEYFVSEIGAKVVVVDHIHQIDHGPGSNSVSELTQTVLMAQRLAKDLGIVIFLFCQVRRREGMAVYMPPKKEDIAGASAIERNAHIIISLWRPLRLGMSMAELNEMEKDVQHGRVGGDSVYEPNTMGVRLLKDRISSDPFGKQVLLKVDRLRLAERDVDDYIAREGNLPTRKIAVDLFGDKT